MHSRNKTTVSPYYDESVRLGTEFQKGNKSWAGYDVVKYQNKIKDLVDLYSAKTILDYGCGKGLQYVESLPYAGEDNWQTFDQFLGVAVYKYDPCVPEHSTLPPVGTKFDGVICTQVLNSIPDDDLGWVAKELESYADKFCFVGLNFQHPAKGKKTMYNPAYFRQPRTREFFRSYFTNWAGSDLFWWWKDRSHYVSWASDQLNGTWKDIPDMFEGKYQFTEAIYR
jgi:hypothetical protein